MEGFWFYATFKINLNETKAKSFSMHGHFYSKMHEDESFQNSLCLMEINK